MGSAVWQCLPGCTPRPVSRARSSGLKRFKPMHTGLVAAAAAPSATENGLAQAAPAVAGLAAASPLFSAMLDLQQAVVHLTTEQLGLSPVTTPAAAGPSGTFATSSADGGAGAAVQAWRGGGGGGGARVHWLSASALANRQLGFGTTRLLGFVGAGCDAPHLALELGLMGPDKLQGIVTLWPRQDLVTDLHYLHKYYSTAPVGSSATTYNDIYNSAMATAQQRPGWHTYQSPVAEVKPLLAASIAYSFPEADGVGEGNLEAFWEVTMQVAQLWAAFLLEAASSPRAAHDEAGLHKYDARYLSAITADPANHIATRLFGEAATNTLLKMATGHPSVSGGTASI